MAVVTVFVVVAASLVITRVGAVALMLTGMSRESSRFQAREDELDPAAVSPPGSSGT